MFVESITCLAKSEITFHGFLLPEGYRPSEEAEPYFPVGREDSSVRCDMYKIKANGNIGSVGPDNDIYFSDYVSYPAEN